MSPALPLTFPAALYIMVNPEVSLVVVQKASTGIAVLQMIGLLLAVFRFWFRYRIQRLWWEDAWAFAAFLFVIIYSMGTWLYVHCEKPTSTVGFWISSFSFNPVI